MFKNKLKFSRQWHLIFSQELGGDFTRQSLGMLLPLVPFPCVKLLPNITPDLWPSILQLIVWLNDLVAKRAIFLMSILASPELLVNRFWPTYHKRYVRTKWPREISSGLAAESAWHLQVQMRGNVICRLMVDWLIYMVWRNQGFAHKLLIISLMSPVGMDFSYFTDTVLLR